ncbi:hypothetical protein BaRGS_00012335 [Batillaria attramentaria]|uniref:Uncharacterized protein n=1 Tax=Batillaria attramentaria TaxID=370345 RepID=A0ABD0LB40_9CAEN
MLGIYVGTGGANAYVGTSVNVTCSVGVLRSAFDHRDPLSKQFVFADFTYFKLSRLVDGKPPEVLAHLERPRPPHEIETPHHFQRWWGDYCVSPCALRHFFGRLCSSAQAPVT